MNVCEQHECKAHRSQKVVSDPLERDLKNGCKMP